MGKTIPICKLCKETRSINNRGLCIDCDVYSDEQLKKTALLDSIENATEDLRHNKESFLRILGWEESCRFPDSCRRWVKAVKGETIAVSLSTAINIEKNIEHYKNANINQKESKDAKEEGN